MTDYRLFSEAYVKMQLHAAKFQASSCSGVLIGEESGGGVFEIVDAVPLFHHESPLTPMTEIAFTFVDVWSQQQKRKIVGFYFANGIGLESNPSLSYSAEKMADQVESNCSRACVLLIENAQLNSEAKTGVQLLLKDVKRGWTRVENRLHLAEETSREHSPIKLFSRALQQNLQDEIVDMDEHFEDVSKDWRNPQLHKLLKLNV